MADECDKKFRGQICIGKKACEKQRKAKADCKAELAKRNETFGGATVYAPRGGHEYTPQTEYRQAQMQASEVQQAEIAQRAAELASDSGPSLSTHWPLIVLVFLFVLLIVFLVKKYLRNG